MFPCYELIYVIVNHGVGSKVLHEARVNGIQGGAVVLGMGTAQSSILNFLSLYDQRKEIVILGSDSETAEKVITILDHKFKFEKPNHGIVFSLNISKFLGFGQKHDKQDIEERGADKTLYQMITTIVSRGKAEDVIEAARKVGSTGGTIINARGSGIHETSKIFNMEIEPEKEIVLILAKSDLTEAIVDSINESLEIEKPGHGILYVQDVSKTYGIRE